MSEMSVELKRLAKEFFKNSKAGCMDAFYTIREEALAELAREKSPGGVFQIYRIKSSRRYNPDSRSYYDTGEEFIGIGYRVVSRYERGFSVRQSYDRPTATYNSGRFTLDEKWASAGGQHLAVTNYKSYSAFRKACERFGVPMVAIEMFHNHAVTTGLIADSEELKEVIL